MNRTIITKDDPPEVPIRIVAIVGDGNSQMDRYVLNRNPVFKYKHLNKNIIYAQDDMFFSCYEYSRPSKEWAAFAGRKFDIHMEDGEVINAFGQWWDGGAGNASKELGLNLINSAYQTQTGLIKCYVFYGTNVDKKGLEKLLADYDGPTYQYWDYEKIIKFDDMRHKLYMRMRKLELAKTHLIKNVKALADRLKEANEY